MAVKKDDWLLFAALSILFLVPLFIVFRYEDRRLRIRKPRTSHMIERVGQTLIRDAYLSEVNHLAGRTTQWELQPEEFDDLTTLLGCLSPLRSYEEGVVDRTDFIVLYQGGMDPTEIRIQVERDSLFFAFDGNPYVYRGGKPVEFSQLVSKLVEKLASRLPTDWESTTPLNPR